MNTDIRLSVGFWQHPKTKKIAKRLGLEGVRSLQILWMWAATNRPEGNLSGMDWEDIELAADWQGEDQVFFTHCLGMWIDETNTGYVLHDWKDHNSWASQVEERNDTSRFSRLSQVNRTAFEKLKAAGFTGISKDDYERVKKDGLGAVGDILANAGERHGDGMANAGGSLAPAPDPNPDTEKKEDIPPLPPTGGCAVPDAHPSLSDPALSDPADMDRGFHEFMAAYPADHRAPEAEAAAAWKKLARAKKLPGLPRLFQGLDEWEACAQWKKNGGEFIPKAANFLRHMMWQDSPPVGSRAPSKPRAPTPWQQNMADKDDLAKALLAERYGENSYENSDLTQAIDIEHRVRNPDDASATGFACR